MKVPGTLDRKTNVADFTFSEIADAWRAMNNGELEVVHNHHKLDDCGQWARNDPKWQGFSIKQANQWLANGYHVEAFDDVHSFAPHIEKRRIRQSEEGDLQYDAFLSGSEMPFITKNKIKVRPGLEIEAELSMNSSTPASVIEEYLVWLNRLAFTCEARGSDVAIRIAHPSTNLFSGPRKSNTRITVKRPGEWLDQTAWSPILSPAGYRGFVHFSMILHAELAGVAVAGHLGFPEPSGRWDVALEDGILRVMTPSSDYQFPEAMMTAKVKKMIEEYR